MDMVNIKINGMPLSVPKGSTILEAARVAGINIPTLCYLKEINEIGACRICMVEVKGARSLVTACVYPVNEGMEVFTNTPKVLESRKTNLELVLSTHNKKCLSCVRSGDCELQTLCKEFGVEDEHRFEGEVNQYELDTSAAHMVRDNSKCILCRRCVAVCSKNQGVGVIGANERGFKTEIGCAFETPLGETTCISCGQCITVCPTGALYEKDSTEEVRQAIADPEKIALVQTAPSIRATLGECFGLPIGTDVEGKMVAALRRLGFDLVFDTDLAADLTIVEEANELIERVQNGGVLPMITSCSPGWIKYCEHYYPEMIPNLSTCKSPQQMFGALAKTWYADKNGIDPKKIVSVSVMPCTAKKFEIDRENQNAAGVPDVDISLTTRELARMIQRAGLDFVNLPDEDFDDPMGESTGAAVIFGATGGVMEAALRTAVEKLTGEELKNLEFTEVRGTEGIKEASYNVGGLDVNVAVVSGTANAKKLLEAVKNGEKSYTFIEVMGCPGGCVNGGGQPQQPASVRNFVDLKGLRAKALYTNDENKAVRKSHENPSLKKIYEDYFGKPGSHKAHEVLHTSYVKRERF
ncbi:NAD(P)-dependent iron-only hydrogenase catalytic subunit [Hydrogenoanaerobacterium saccharovorans]|uniref:NAD(P)-dependent iron-only hydrogenase catalytic subunit n=1 Tax=Hydrogenoanaerobacterium saccharovorans TaxID=474960 RepID=A0A1H8CG57_9FIRM|nr:NADH-dependent [FeFe] hydrogenase, group A6 [Hydrogenoanaerobacterium saccharovorans]RPF43089.1 NAD(P)-dependent iron-only hydrogenase catalytic subunit [Hydrogenoanaerobacterium saccharovorans]SEM94035.1 NAD(P)-dependent iron-only hydrogenase catalytic subunit [Hydrogenoanaerobacterium saccharovorans]